MKSRTVQKVCHVNCVEHLFIYIKKMTGKEKSQPPYLQVVLEGPDLLGVRYSLGFLLDLGTLVLLLTLALLDLEDQLSLDSLYRGRTGWRLWIAEEHFGIFFKYIAYVGTEIQAKTIKDQYVKISFRHTT